MSNINPALIDVVLPVPSGYPADIAALDTRDTMRMMAQDAGAIVTDFPSHLWIEKKDWAAVAAENDKNRTWPIDYLDRYTNQGSGNGGYSTHECTTHCFRAVFEGARNRQRKIVLGPPVPGKRLEISAQSASVWISCLSLYSEANPSEWGGAGVRQILSIAARRGCLPDSIQPREYGFKHTLYGTCGAGGINQSRGKWTAVKNFPDGWQETAKHLKPLEYIFPDSLEETICLLLHGLLVGVGRDGHSIPYGKVMVEEELVPYTDSYDIMRFDSFNKVRSTIGGSYTVVSTTAPDNWDKPGE